MFYLGMYFGIIYYELFIIIYITFCACIIWIRDNLRFKEEYIYVAYISVHQIIVSIKKNPDSFLG